MDTLLTTLGDSLLAPAGYFLDPAKRVYWMYSLASLGLAAGLMMRHHGLSPLQALRRLGEVSRWWTASTRMDLQLLVTNSVVRALLILPLVVPPATVTVAVAALLELSLGEPTTPGLSRSAIGMAYTVTLFGVSDLSRYIVHRLFHSVPALWALHQVHHSATTLTPLTLYRIHPLESLILELRRALAIGLTTGVFLYLFEGALNGYDVLGINLFGFLFNLSGANLRHSNTFLSYGGALEHLFISPAQHQLHHSEAAEHHHKNYGSCLALWDWLFGTLLVARHRQPLRYGLGDAATQAPRRLHQALFSPLLQSLRALRPGATSLNRQG